MYRSHSASFFGAVPILGRCFPFESGRNLRHVSIWRKVVSVVVSRGFGVGICWRTRWRRRASSFPLLRCRAKWGPCLFFFFFLSFLFINRTVERLTWSGKLRSEWSPNERSAYVPESRQFFFSFMWGRWWRIHPRHEDYLHTIPFRAPLLT
jgi:hypothetical protein